VTTTTRADTCWVVSPAVIPTTTGVAQLAVRVRDLVGWQNGLPPATQTMSPPAKGIEACTAQPNYLGVPMYINFIAVDGDNNAVGIPYQYQLETDLVGPPAPAGLCETVGETVYNLSFTPNTDLDTIGYDVYLDPIPGEVPSSPTIALDAGSVVVCPAAADNPGDGGCVTVSTGSTLPATSGTCATQAVCSDLVLGTPPIVPTVTADSGSEAGTEEAGDAAAAADAGDADADAHADTGSVADTGAEAEGVEAGGETGNGGISAIPQGYLLKPSPVGTIPDKSIGQYQVTGLVDFVVYNAVVAAVDGIGNIGPPSSEVCDYPAPVDDFWQNYRRDGGGANGYCALETIGARGTSLAGVAGVFLIGAVARRRRKRGD
jgi:hypothetical protein